MLAPLRTVRLRPYRKGAGPTFTLKTWTTGRYDARGQSTIAYSLRQHEAGRTSILFEGADFYGSPLHADDSDATMEALLGFLTLRPGDTDASYFENYTEAQMEFCRQHAEALACEALNRFGDRS